MPPPVVTASAARWREIGGIVRARRLSLGLTQDELGVSKAVVSLLEHGKQRSFARSTLAKVSRSLRWTSDSLELMAGGGSPAEGTEVDEDVPGSMAVLQQLVVRHDRDLEEVRRRLAVLEARSGLRAADTGVGDPAPSVVARPSPSDSDG